MGFNKAESNRLRTGIKTSENRATSILGSSNASDTIELNIVASKVTLQPSGDLVGTYSVSADGVNFVAVGALPAAGTLASYNTHNVIVIKFDRSSGTGRVVILAVS